MKKLFLVACATVVLAAVTAAGGQEAARFSAASIKQNLSGLAYGQSTDRPDGVALVNERLRDVILFAFGIYDFQLTGDPGWVLRDRFDITARADGPLSLDQKRARLALRVNQGRNQSRRRIAEPRLRASGNRRTWTKRSSPGRLTSISGGDLISD